MMNRQIFGRKWSWHNLRNYPGICVEGLREITKLLSHDSRFPRFEPGTARIRRRSVSHSTTTIASSPLLRNEFQQCVPMGLPVPKGPPVPQQDRDRQTDMDLLIRRSLLTLWRGEHLTATQRRDCNGPDVQNYSLRQPAPSSLPVISMSSPVQLNTTLNKYAKAERL